MSVSVDSLPANSDSCFVCGGVLLAVPRSDYRRCSDCAHEMLAAALRQRFIVNDCLERPQGLDARDGFQRRVARKAAVESRLLVDIGCGSGRFLHFNRDDFEEHLGIEVTAACVAFARSHWALKVETRLPALARPPSLVTFWHSLEHIPPVEAMNMLAQLRRESSRLTRLVVCVPNARSWQAAVFGRGWTYYDAPNHLHQFGPGSLERLLAKCGFAMETDFFSFIYGFAGWLLSFINLVTPDHNYFYYRKKRGERSKYGPAATAALDAFCYFAAACCIIPALLLALLEKFSPGRRAVITCSFKPDCAKGSML